jgi:hypothetical protein
MVMNTTIRNVLSALAVVMAASCAHAPQLYDNSKAMEQERNAYIKDHPDGKFNDYIAKGEIAKGMDQGAVIASWGSPGNTREIDSGRYEQWVYATKDSVSQRWTIFSLAFDNDLLTRWTITENVITGEGIQPALDKVPVFSPSDFDRENVDQAPIKKDRF